MTNVQLRELYTSFFDIVKLDTEMAKRCSPPLLVNVDPSWESSKRRILIVGQETLGWGFRSGEYYNWPYPPIARYSDFVNFLDRINALMLGYKKFEFAKHQPENRRSPFWRAFRYLGSSNDVSVLWTNLFRFSVDSGSVIRNCSTSQLECVLNAQRGLLKKEIQLLNPSVVVFFTGPDYDQALLNEFSDAVLQPIQGHIEREFAQVQAAILPSHSYRMYHPGYLARSAGRWAWLDELVQLIRA